MEPFLDQPHQPRVGGGGPHDTRVKNGELNHMKILWKTNWITKKEKKSTKYQLYCYIVRQSAGAAPLKMHLDNHPTNFILVL